MKIDWKRKLSSRKFWAMLAALILSVLTAFGVPELKSEQVVVIVTGIGAIAVYMLAEGAVDKEAVDSGEFDSVKEETDLGE
jgi:hypothetical protein